MPPGALCQVSPHLLMCDSHARDDLGGGEREPHYQLKHLLPFPPSPLQFPETMDLKGHAAPRLTVNTAHHAHTSPHGDPCSSEPLCPDGIRCSVSARGGLGCDSCFYRKSVLPTPVLLDADISLPLSFLILSPHQCTPFNSSHHSLCSSQASSLQGDLGGPPCMSDARVLFLWAQSPSPGCPWRISRSPLIWSWPAEAGPRAQVNSLSSFPKCLSEQVNRDRGVIGGAAHALDSQLTAPCACV